MNRRILALTALSAVLSFGATLGQADVWRWVDGAGRVHYSDVPIEGAVRVKTSAPRQAVSGDASRSAGLTPTQTVASTGVAINERLQNDAASRAVQGDLAKKRAEQCKEATERYDRSIAARRLFREGKGGEKVYLTDAEIDQARLEARRDRDTACNPGATPR